MFCKNCGNEINEKAIICPKCGCAIEEETQLTKRTTIINESNSYLNLCFNIVNYITVGLICLTLTAFALSIGLAEIYTSVSATDSRYYFHAYSYFNPNISALIVSFVLSICGYAFETTSFVLGFFKNNKTKRITSDVLFIIVNCLLFLLLFCCSIHLF